jgi:outer membrane protein, heavy metal efflux system
MKRKALLAMFVVMFSSTQCLWALQQPDDANDLKTLSDYLHYASLNNAALKASFEQWQSVAEEGVKAGALPDPKFTYELETRRSPKSQTLGISQALPWFGTIQAQVSAAKASENAAERRYYAQKLKLFADVKNAFYDYSYLARQLEIGKENLDILKHFEEVVQTRYTTAQATHPDIILAQIELATMENDLKNLELMRSPLVAKLNSILNREDSTPLPWPVKETFKEMKLNNQEVITLLAKNSPELQAMNFDIDQAKQQVELAKKKSYPELELGFSVMQRSEATMGQGEEPAFAMISLTLPIWQDSYKAAERQAKAQVRKVQQERTETKNDMVARVEKLLYDVEIGTGNLKLYENILIPKAKEHLIATEDAYQSGTVDFLRLLNSQQLLLTYQLQYEQAVVENARKLAELEMLVGTELLPTESAK